MRRHDIKLNTLLPIGHVATHLKDDALYMTVTRNTSVARFDRGHLSIGSYVRLPDKYRLPMRIDMTVKIDTPGFYVFIGNGHVNFGTPWSDNRRLDDIAEPTLKTMFFHNYISMGEYADISLIYDLSCMQILINGEERYYSKKEKYMKSPLFGQMNDEGFEVKLTCDKRTDTYIKSIQITEYDGMAGIVHTDKELPAAINTNEAAGKGEKPILEACIERLPEDIRREIIDIDAWLHALRPMQFKRQIEKHGNKITYIASEYGFSYAIYPSNDVMYHTLQWYIVTSSKPELWHRKSDRMEETLNKLAEADPAVARRMFDNLTECIGCCVNGCAVKTLYSLGGGNKLTCHGKMGFKMRASEFGDVKLFIEAVNDL